MMPHATDTGRLARQPGKGRGYEVLLVSEDEHPGYMALCPSLPGCLSCGETREEALEMIADAISMWLDSYDGQEHPYHSDAMAQTVAEYEADGFRTEKALVKPADWDQIIADCDAAILCNPNDAKAYVERGGAYLNKREYGQAIADYTAAIRIAPDDAEPYTSRGNTYLSSKEYNLAIADYDSALRRDPYDEEAIGNLEAAYVQLRACAKGA